MRKLIRFIVPIIGIMCSLLIAIQILFYFPAPVDWLAAKWTVDGLISFIGTVFLGAVAIFQTKKANDISKRLLDMEEARLQPQIDIRPIKKDDIKIHDYGSIILSNMFDVFYDNSEIFTYQNDDILIFSIKNLKNTDLLNVQPITLKARIIDEYGVVVLIGKFQLCTSCMPNYIEEKGTIPLVIETKDFWCNVAEEPNRRLLLSIEFLLLNSDGHKYIQTCELEIVNANQTGFVSPVIVKKTINQAIKMEEKKNGQDENADVE